MAKRVFRDAIPPQWVIQELSPDYGIDYHLTVYASERPTPLRTAVQLKGMRQPHVVGDAVHFSLETARLEQYVDTEPLPVLLVVADVNKGSAWFVHLQAFALDSLHGKEWRKQTKVTISVPFANDLRATHLSALSSRTGRGWRALTRDSWFGPRPTRAARRIASLHASR